MSDKINMSLDEIIKQKKESQQKQRMNKKKPHVQNKQKPFKRNNSNSKRKDKNPKQKPKVQKEAEPSKTKLFIKGLSIGTTNNELNDAFTVYGKLVSCGINWDKLGRSKGTAQVEYKTAEEAATALEKLNNTEIAGHTITVAYFKSKEE
ncbi:unnamed protein product [Blepharisma stoltei]|uniref:RRM domain-containing protein n=1 Tax=Blepharisma stoltei TaxID=1481888 RepID=A0AAU9K5L8_9CILI|nr:unnamed protein product [Blepharisma stoltei]